MFKTRSGGPGNTSPASPPSIEAVRRRARHRLIGASVLVLAGVIGFPILFDTQPRPIAVDLPINIPGRQNAKPLAIPPAVQVVPPEGATPPNPPAPAASAPSLVAPVVGKTPAPVITETASGEEVADKLTVKPAAKATDKPLDKPVDKAPANLVDKPSTKVVVQVGAFAEADRAREVRQRLERAGLKTYTHVADTPQGKRIRVRVGPFATKAEADKAAQKVKGLGLPAAVLTL